MKKLLIALLYFSSLFWRGVGGEVCAQDSHLVDSLEAQLKNHNAKKMEMHIKSPSMNDTTAADILYSLSKAYWGADPDKAVNYAEHVLKLSQQIGYKKGMGNAYNSMGFVNGKKGEFAAALELHKKALKIREDIDDKSGIGSSYGNMGIIYFNQGNYSEALKCHYASLKIKEQIGDKVGIGNAYNNIAVVYADQGNEEEALKNFFSCLRIMDQLGNKPVSAFVSSNIGNIYHSRGDYTEAMRNFKAALKIQEEMGDQFGLATTYTNLGNTYLSQNNFEEALKCYFAAIKICDEIENKDGLAMAYSNIGLVYTEQKKYSEAESYLNKSLLVAKEIGSPERMKTSYSGLAALDSVQGNYKQSFEHYKLFIAMRDSMVNDESTKKTMQLQLQYDFDKKQVADSLKFAQEKEIGEVKLQKQKALTYAGYAGVFIAVVLLFFVYRNYKKQRLANQQLKEAQQQLIKSEKMAAFGVMATRMAHEIQNPLNFVNNFSELSQDVVTDIIHSQSEEEKKHNAQLLIDNLKKINEHGKRAASIINQLQEHTRKGSAHEFFEKQ